MMEVEEMINKVREQQGRPFDPKQLTTSCVANIIMNMLFGHRFDHSDSAFQQHISEVNDAASSYSMALEIYPLLRFLPYFKKRLAESHRALRNGFSFTNSNIDTCLLVCMAVSVTVFFCKICGITQFIGGKNDGLGQTRCQCLT